MTMQKPPHGTKQPFSAGVGDVSEVLRKELQYTLASWHRDDPCTAARSLWTPGKMAIVFFFSLSSGPKNSVNRFRVPQRPGFTANSTPKPRAGPNLDPVELAVLLFFFLCLTGKGH